MLMTSTIAAKNAVYSFVLVVNLCNLFLFQDNALNRYFEVQDGYIDFLFMFNLVQGVMNLILIALSMWLLYDNNRELWIDRFLEKVERRFNKIKKFFRKKRKP